MGDSKYVFLGQYVLPLVIVLQGWRSYRSIKSFGYVMESWKHIPISTQWNLFATFMVGGVVAWAGLLIDRWEVLVAGAALVLVGAFIGPRLYSQDDDF